MIYPFLTAFAVIATGNHFVLDLAGGLAAIALAVVLARAMYGTEKGSWRSAGLRWGRAGKPRGPAYRMSQTCYEVQDRVD